jgi:phage anti-repressor protein
MLVKSYLTLTCQNRKIVVRARSIQMAETILMQETNEKSKHIRKLQLTDLIEPVEQLLVLPNKEYI